MAKRKLSWKPKRNGIYYCAPACGANCTWKAYTQADKDAKKLIKTLGPGWKAHVFDNMGWYYGVTSPCGLIRLSPFIFRGAVDSYSVFSGPHYASAKTPQRAVKKMVDILLAELKDKSNRYRQVMKWYGR